MRTHYLLTVLLLGACASSVAQNYHAAYGSNYTSSINVTNNPAAILSSPYKWDLTLFGTQLKSATNAFTLHNYSLLSSPANSAWAFNEGDFARKADINFNTNVLNARIALSRTKAIAFGANVRGYTRLRTSSFNFVDTLQDITNFFLINNNVTSYDARFITSNWVELFGSYGQTVIDDSRQRLNAGVTLKLSRGISGGYARVQNVTIGPGGGAYQVNSGAATYGYSSNFEPWIDDSTQTFGNFITNSQSGISFDFGLEYIIKTEAVNTFYDDDDYYEYEWKIGVSLLDLGINRYRYGLKSLQAANPIPNLTNVDLESKFSPISSLEEFRDSLSTIVGFASGFSGDFTVLNPTRLVVNVDRYLINNFYLNAEASINLSPLAGDKRLFVREMNFLTVTPRWETRNLGAYLPMQYNNAGKFWIGAAFKAGPLLLGVHNLKNLFSKTSVQNGGAYLALIIHPWKKNEKRRYNKLDCPKP